MSDKLKYRPLLAMSFALLVILIGAMLYSVAMTVSKINDEHAESTKKDSITDKISTSNRKFQMINGNGKKSGFKKY